MGARDPRLDCGGTLDFRLTRTWSAWKKIDPPPLRVKPIPIKVLRRVATLAKLSSLQFQKGVSDMITLAFFFLLRPGEYTDTNSESTPFTLGDVQLWIGPNHRLDLKTATAAELRTATFATLTFTTQKNGVRGEVIGLGLSGDPLLCPVGALVRRILYLRSHGATDKTPLSRLFKERKVALGGPTHIQPKHITKELREAVTSIGPRLGFVANDVSARSLRAAGANALLLADVDTNIIRIIGRWKSDEMLRYLTCQAAPLMEHYSRKMLAGGDYVLLPNKMVPDCVAVPLW